MLIYLAFIISLVLYKIKILHNNDYMNIWHTTCINGIFILFVFFRHVSQYVSFPSYWDYPMNLLDTKLYQFLVVTFLFYSGYGIYESIKKNKNYINNMPKNRIFKVWLQFAIAITLFLIVGLIFKRNLSFLKIILSYLGWESLGNSNWYIFYVLISYLFVYISFTAVDNNKNDKLSLILITIMSILYIIILKKLKPSYWYNTALCFPAGMWFSFYKQKIDDLILKNNKLWFLILSICLLIAFLTYKTKSNIWIYEICAIFIMLSILLITMKISIGNKILYWLGKNLFGLYILQRLPMIILSKLNIIQNPYSFTIICFIIMIIIGYLFNRVFAKIYDEVFKNETK